MRPRHIRRKHLLVDVSALTGGGFLIDLVRSHSWVSGIAAAVLLAIAFVMDNENVTEEVDAEDKTN